VLINARRQDLPADPVAAAPVPVAE
jgi:hypothetical protein